MALLQGEGEVVGAPGLTALRQLLVGAARVLENVESVLALIAEVEIARLGDPIVVDNIF